jgi:hypothetical protein
VILTKKPLLRLQIHPSTWEQKDDNKKNSHEMRKSHPNCLTRTIRNLRKKRREKDLSFSTLADYTIIYLTYLT